MSDLESNPTPVSDVKLPPLVMIACFWPIMLVAFGGLVGGILGGAAGGINMLLYRSSIPRWAFWVLNPVIGCLAFILWLIIAIVIGAAFDGSETN